MQDLPFDIASLHSAYADGLKLADVISECHRRIVDVDDPGIFLHLFSLEEVQGHAAALGPFDPIAMPLWGIPFAIKDNIDAAAAPTTAACPAYTYHPEDDAFVVAQLRQAGAILIGKTNLDQFATGLVGVRTPYSVPKNAIDPDIVPGGSSSGSAVAVSHGIVSFALGTDTAGSGRVPAALNNIVGLKPSLGAISNSGVVPACLSLDTVSIFALTVEDAYRAYQSAANYDPFDSFSKSLPTPNLGLPRVKCRIGVPDATSREFFGDTVQADSFATTLEQLVASGVEILELNFAPLYAVAKMLYDGVWVAERYAAVEHMIRSSPDDIHPTTRQIIEVAESFNAVDTFNAFYELQRLKRVVEPVLADTDLLCVPTIPTFATVQDLETDPIGPNSRLGTYTNFVNLMDMCGIAVPVSSRTDGRPGSVTLLAPSGEDATIAAIASVIHQQSGATMGATGWTLPIPVVVNNSATKDEIEIAVVGAHMSGLPLNHELTGLKARFLRADKTSPAYRLFSLPGGPPSRPGLIRDDNGTEIELEVWALPLTNFGAFIEGVPQPLGIGTLTLADGTNVKGFLCEHLATIHAEDVTEFGGWREYLKDQSLKTTNTKESAHA